MCELYSDSLLLSLIIHLFWFCLLNKIKTNELYVCLQANVFEIDFIHGCTAIRNNPFISLLFSWRPCTLILRWKNLVRNSIPLTVFPWDIMLFVSEVYLSPNLKEECKCLISMRFETSFCIREMTIIHLRHMQHHGDYYDRAHVSFSTCQQDVLKERKEERKISNRTQSDLES